MRLAIWGHLCRDVQREGEPKAIITRCKSVGINTYLAYVLPAVAVNPRDGADPRTVKTGYDFNTQEVAYNSMVFQAGNDDVLTPLLNEAKKEGVEVEPWLLPFSGSLLVGETTEELRSRTYQPLDRPKGDLDKLQWRGVQKIDKSLCATWPENRARAIVMLKDYIEQHGANLTGIHMDAIRYGDVVICLAHPCHCAACRKEYDRLIGKDTLTAEELKLPGVRYKFMQFRNECIRSVVEEVRDITNKAGLRLTMAARNLFFEYTLLEGQDWPQWARDGLVDIVFVMNYSTDRAQHREHLLLHASLMKDRGRALYYDGVGKKSSMGVNTTENVVTFARDSLDAGVDGICIFHYDGMEDKDFEAIKALGA